MVLPRKKLKANASLITYLSISSLLVVLVLQGYFVYDHFRLTQNSLSREIDAVLKDVYQKDLNTRNSAITHSNADTIITLSPLPSNIPSQDKEVVAYYNLDEIGVNANDMAGCLNTMLNDYTSQKVPVNIVSIDSITQAVLKARGIKSDFVVRIINPVTKKVLLRSKDLASEDSGFLLYSEYLPLDFSKQKSLQLILLNPLSGIFKRMGLLLSGSALLALFCLYGIWFLFRTLSRQKQLNVVKNDFFGHTAHELKRPVAHLTMALEALSKPSIDENRKKKERYLAISKEATRDMAEKIGMIMTLSMAEEGVFRLNICEFDLLEVIGLLKEKFTAIAEKKVTISVNNLGDKLQISADKDHLTQSISNLIDNAIKYSDDSVHITISAEKKGGDLILCVKDDGIGIAQDKLSSVFEKYTRLNTVSGAPSGFGIGLNYVKTVIDKHKGRIEVFSEIAQGSEFRVFLPV